MTIILGSTCTKIYINETNIIRESFWYQKKPNSLINISNFPASIPIGLILHIFHPIPENCRNHAIVRLIIGQKLKEPTNTLVNDDEGSLDIFWNVVPQKTRIFKE